MDCSYCSEFSGDMSGSHYLKNLFSQVGSARLCLDSDNFYIYPSVGSLIVGHLLVVPKRHYTALSYSNALELEELYELLLDLKLVQQSLFGLDADMFIFEHGVLDKEKSMMSCVDHAHLHVLPALVDVHSLGFSDFSQVDIREICGEDISHPDYIFFGSLEYSFVSLDRDKHPQYLRKILHEKLRLPGHWNWRSDPKVENIKAWLTCFSCFVEKGGFSSLKLRRLRLVG